MHPDNINASTVLRDLRRRGLLVPVLGAGVSMAGPSSGGPSWPVFLAALRLKANMLAAADPEKVDMSAAMSAAWVAMRRLRAMPILGDANSGSDQFPADIIDECINGKTVRGTRTAQLDSLAEHSWPLVITMNYDGGYQAAVEIRQKKQLKKQHAPEEIPEAERVRTVHRTVEDCLSIARALITPKQPLCWAIHGQVPTGTNNDQYGIKDLVVSGEDYRNALHSEPHFRHTISAVVRQRALLFVGTGLEDEHINDILDEDAQHLGAPALPRFAIMVEDKSNAGKHDQHRLAFLRVERGITPLLLAKEDIPDFLQKITEDRPAAIEAANSASHAVASESTLLDAREIAGTQTSVRIVDSSILAEAAADVPGWILGLSAGINRNGAWTVSTWIEKDLKHIATAVGGLAPGGSVVSVPGTRGIWLVQSQRTNNNSSQGYVRDFTCIMTSVQEICSQAARAKRKLRLNLIGGGEGKDHPAAWHLIAMLTAIRRWAAEAPNESLEVTIHLYQKTDASVIAELRGPRLPAAAILAGPPWPVWIDGSEVGDKRHRRILLDPWSMTCDQLLGEIGCLPGLRVTAEPESSRASATGEDLLSKLGVLPGSTVKLHRA